MASTHRDEISRLELLHAAHPDGLVFPHLADAYRRAGRYAQAESVLNAGLRRHADYSSAHVVLGRLRLDQGKRQEAESSFQRVLQLDPQNHVALEFLGRLAEEEGRAEEALGYLRRLASLKASEELGEQIAALERQAAEARQVPSAPAAGVAAAAAEDPARSVANASGASGNGGGSAAEDPPPVELPEPGEVVTETMAELYTRQGLHERAEAVYRQLAERDPGNARLRGKLEQAATRRDGEHGEAVQAPAAQEAPAASPGVSQGSISGSSIGDYMGGVLAWSPDAADGGASDAAQPAAGETWEPVTDASVTGVADPSPVEPDSTPTQPDAPADTDLELEPWASAPVSEPTPWGESPISASPRVPEPDPTEEPPREPASQEPISQEPTSQEPTSQEPTSQEPTSQEPTSQEPEPWAASPEPGPEPAVGVASEAPPEPKPVTPPTRVPPTPAEPSAEAAAVPPEPAGPAAPRSRPGPTPGELGLEEDDLEGADARTRALIAVTDMLVGLLEYRDPFFRGSSSLTRLLATNVAAEMGLDASDRMNLALAAVLRDLGRLALGGRLVETPKGTRTAEARRKIERHVDLALQLMEGIELPRSVTLAVRHHHERWDGAGYPDGLSGDEIPQVARVLAAVDSFAAMVSPRSYRLPRKVADAAQEMQAAAGTQYDPDVVDALLRVLDRRDQPHLGFVQRHHILLVNPDQPGAVVTAAKLCTAGYLAEVAVEPDTARERLRRIPVAALVVSAETGADAAEELIHDLRLDPLFASLPIVVVDAESVELRVRLLESGADVCFPPGISHGELQGTLGALVRRTLRSRETRPDGGDEDSPWLALQGDVQDFPLAWLLQVMKYDSRTAGIGIRTASDQGAIYIENGDAVHAQIRGAASGEKALKTMLRWSKGRFTVQPDARSKERSIESSIMHLLLTQAVEEDHAAAGIFGAVSDQG